MQCQDGFLDLLSDKEAGVILSIFTCDEFKGALA
jgi:hypothetical protein